MCFLVDHQLNVKLSDLELGTSSEFGSAASKSNILPKKRRKGQELSCFDRATNFLTYGIFGSQQQKKNDMRRRRRKRATKDLLDAASSPIGLTVVDPFGPADPQDAKLVTSTAGVPKGSIVPPPVMKRTHSRDSSASNSLSFSISFQSDSSGAPAEDLLSADDFLANWSAPEVIQDGVHVQRSDVYALSLVFWEILFGSQPFSSTRRQDDIRFKVSTVAVQLFSFCSCSTYKYSFYGIFMMHSLCCRYYQERDQNCRLGQ